MHTVLPKPGRGAVLKNRGMNEFYATEIRIFRPFNPPKEWQKMGFNRDLNPGPPAD